MYSTSNLTHTLTDFSPRFFYSSATKMKGIKLQSYLFCRLQTSPQKKKRTILKCECKYISHYVPKEAEEDKEDELKRHDQTPHNGKYKYVKML